MWSYLIFGQPVTVHFLLLIFKFFGEFFFLFWRCSLLAFSCQQLYVRPSLHIVGTPTSESDSPILRFFCFFCMYLQYPRRRRTAAARASLTVSPAERPMASTSTTSRSVALQSRCKLFFCPLSSPPSANPFLARIFRIFTDDKSEILFLNCFLTLLLFFKICFSHIKFQLVIRCKREQKIIHI